MVSNSISLTIGISAYQHIRPLPASVANDAASMHALVESNALGLYAPENILHLTDADATGAAIRAALVTLAQCSTVNSTILIYFSGHGGQISAGEHAGAYLLPVDARYGSDTELAETSISSQEFSDALRQIRARRVVVFFDCCHSGGIGQPKSLSGAVLKSGLPDLYYKELASGWGRVIIASSRENEVSWVNPGDSNSLFTRHLLEGLRGQAVGTGEFVRILDLFGYLHKVTQAQPNQHPVLKAEIEENFPVAWIKDKAHSFIGQEPGQKTANDGFRYDVFISYRHVAADRVWVRKQLIPALEAAGLDVCLDDRDFGLGKPLILEMQRAVVESRYTLAIFSPDYLTSGFTELENIMAQHLGAETRKVRLIGVRWRDCPLDLRFRAMRMLDMGGEDFEFTDNIRQIVKACQEPVMV